MSWVPIQTDNSFSFRANGDSWQGMVKPTLRLVGWAWVTVVRTKRSITAIKVEELQKISKITRSFNLFNFGFFHLLYFFCLLVIYTDGIEIHKQFAKENGNCFDLKYLLSFKDMILSCLSHGDWSWTGSLCFPSVYLATVLVDRIYKNRTNCWHE